MLIWLVPKVYWQVQSKKSQSNVHCIVPIPEDQLRMDWPLFNGIVLFWPLNISLSCFLNQPNISEESSSLGWRRTCWCFVASGGIPTSGLGVRHVGIFIFTTLDFLFAKNLLRLELGASWACWWALGACVGVSHPQGGIKNSNLMLSLVEGSLE